MKKVGKVVWMEVWWLLSRRSKEFYLSLAFAFLFGFAVACVLYPLIFWIVVAFVLGIAIGLVTVFLGLPMSIGWLKHSAMIVTLGFIFSLFSWWFFVDKLAFCVFAVSFSTFSSIGWIWCRIMGKKKTFGQEDAYEKIKEGALKMIWKARHFWK